MWPADLPPSTRIVDVTLRDGLQVVSQVLPVAAKLDIVAVLLAAGLTDVEVTSFAHPRVLPQFADAAELLARLPRPAGVRYRALVPNLTGARRAAQCRLDVHVAVVSADDEVSVRNQGRPTAAVLAELPAMQQVASASGAGFGVVVACAFFAPARGPVPWPETERVVQAAVDAGAAEVCLATTSGVEHPAEVAEGVRRVVAAHPGLPVGCHLHNRNGAAPANALAALAAGASWLEGATGGLGGDLWFPAPDPAVLGNAPTEDLAHLLEAVGVTTGLDVEALRRAAGVVADRTGRAPASFVARGGTRSELAAASWPD